MLEYNALSPIRTLRTLENIRYLTWNIDVGKCVRGRLEARTVIGGWGGMGNWPKNRLAKISRTSFCFGAISAERWMWSGFVDSLCGQNSGWVEARKSCTTAPIPLTSRSYRRSQWQPCHRLSLTQESPKWGIIRGLGTISTSVRCVNLLVLRSAKGLPLPKALSQIFLWCLEWGTIYGPFFDWKYAKRTQTPSHLKLAFISQSTRCSIYSTRVPFVHIKFEYLSKKFRDTEDTNPKRLNLSTIAHKK